MNKRGPKPSGVTKVVYYRRIKPELVAELDDVLAKFDGSPGVLSAGGSNGLESKGIAIVGPSVVQGESPLLKREIDVLKNQLGQMTASYEAEFKMNEGLVSELAAAREEINRIACWSEDDKVKYWRNRALVAEAAIKSKTNEFDQG